MPKRKIKCIALIILSPEIEALAKASGETEWNEWLELNRHLFHITTNSKGRETWTPIQASTSVPK